MIRLLPYLIQLTIDSSHFIENLLGPYLLFIYKTYLDVGRFGISIVFGIRYTERGSTDLMLTVNVLGSGICDFSFVFKFFTYFAIIVMVSSLSLSVFFRFFVSYLYVLTFHGRVLAVSLSSIYYISPNLAPYILNCTLEAL